jgi:hypothetical protein
MSKGTQARLAGLLHVCCLSCPHPRPHPHPHCDWKGVEGGDVKRSRVCEKDIYRSTILEKRGKHLRKGERIFKLLRCLRRPSLRHQKYRSFLFRRADLLNRTDPGVVATHPRHSTVNSLQSKIAVGRRKRNVAVAFEFLH